MFQGSLRSKFLFALVLISALLTFSTLLLVRHRVEIRVREEIVQGLTNSVSTFRTLQRQRETTLERSAALLASLPPLKAVMTSQDTATIEDASTTFWELSGSQLFVLADRFGNLMAVHVSTPSFTKTEAHESMARSLTTRLATGGLATAIFSRCFFNRFISDPLGTASRSAFSEWAMKSAGRRPPTWVAWLPAR